MVWMKKWILALFVVLAAALLPQDGYAKDPFEVLRVRGGGLENEIEITEPALLRFFSFCDFSTAFLPEPPANAQALLAQSYEITRFVRDERTGELAGFDRLHYIPGGGDASGWVFYDGILNGSSEYDQKWCQVDQQDEEIFRRAVASQVDPVGFFLDERQGWITVLGALLGFSALARWAWERWVKPRA
jgi:hypothetical protein